VAKYLLYVSNNRDIYDSYADDAATSLAKYWGSKL
jgi:hypothetical protein